MEEHGFKVLVVDDEPEIRRFLRASLKNHRHEVVEADTGAKAVSAVREYNPDLIILDLGLPDIDGVEVTKRIRDWSKIPIIILSVRSQEADKIEALNAGADDYLTKPFGVGELLARIRVVMRRVGNTGTQPVYQVDTLTMNLDRREVTVDGRHIDLTHTEFEILSILIQNAGKVVTQRQLIQKVWGAAYENEFRLLRVNISNLRKKIEPDQSRPCFILTELGIGYRMKAPQ
jgi:two-component system, OmpR family, KDP operon response regulator KdpE